MSTAVHEEVEEVDLSKLISFGMAFEPLQLTIRDILHRLARLERQNVSQDDRIAELSANVNTLEEAKSALEVRVAELEAQAEKAATEANKETVATDNQEGNEKAGGLNSDNDAIWDEIARLNSLLGELQEGAERDRHTIDEIYAARKRHHSMSPLPAGGAAGGEGAEKGAASRVGSAGVAANAAAPVASARKPSAARPLWETEEVTSAKPVGDVILEKAHEELQFGGTQVYPASDEAASAAGGEAQHGSVGFGGGQGQQQSRPHSVSISIGSRPMSGGHNGGGEDAGEHRGSSSLAVTPHSRRASQAQRRSVYADQRVAAAAARRASQLSNDRASVTGLPTASVFDKLKRDGDDIAYLNRVVAEILGEMKDLHADVDQLRTNQESGESTERKLSQGTKEGSVTQGSVGASQESLDEVRHRLDRVEAEVVDTRQQLQRRDDGLQEELDELKKQLRVARNLTDDDLDALRNMHNLLERLKQLEELVRALEVTQGALSDQFSSVLAIGEKGGDGSSGSGTSDVNPLQFAALQGTVKNLEKQLTDLLAAQGGQQDWSEQIRKLSEAVRAVEGNVEVAQSQLQRTAKEVTRLEEVKANKSELPDTALLLNNRRRSSADSDLVAELMSRMTRTEGSIERLNEDKADRSALQKLRDELKGLRQLVEQVNAQRRSSGNVDGSNSAAMDKLLREMQVDLNNLKDAYRNNNGNLNTGLGGEDIEDLKDRIERLDHCKADATLVANKAERDYVENALERLMREVEQVLNATNAGLIDTLEKSLNILRDMIDGKATKQDVANLQGWMAEANGGAVGSGIGVSAGAADGLTGFKGFRCLGCNRPMDSMRPRTLPATMTPFLNRNPQNFPQDNVTRTIQQQQRMVVPANSFSAGPRPAATAGSPDVSLHRSTSSEPLPPIEPA